MSFSTPAKLLDWFGCDYRFCVILIKIFRFFAIELIIEPNAVQKRVDLIH